MGAMGLTGKAVASMGRSYRNHRNFLVGRGYTLEAPNIPSSGT